MKKVLLLLLLCLLGSFYSSAQYLYGLDPTFANNGILLADSGAYGKIAIQPDNKIIVSGYQYKNGRQARIVRYNQDGTIDHSFADNGYFFPNIPADGTPTFNALCVQFDGKILLAGSIDTGVTDEDFLLVRVKPDGTMDSSFGGGGYVITPHIPQFGVWLKEYISSVAIEPNGNILAYGRFGQSDDSICIIRYKPDGRIDSSFGINGKSIPAREYGFEYPNPNNIALTPDGRIVIGTEAKIATLGTFAFTAIRLLPTGSLDTTFNHTGVACTNNNLPGLLYCKAMCLQPDGKILLAGHADSLAVVRFDSSGKLDNSFGTNGLVKLAPAGKIVGMLLQPDGKIILATNPTGEPYPDTCYTLYRIMPDGKVDSSFGIEGKVSTKIVNASNKIGGVALQTDGKLLVSGFNLFNTNVGKAMLVRYTANATSFENVDFQNQLVIYPNPAGNHIYIDSPTVIKIIQLSFYSPDGKLLLTQIFPDTHRLSTESLANGIYYLKLNLDNHQQVIKKIIIQKN